MTEQQLSDDHQKLQTEALSIESRRLEFLKKIVKLLEYHPRLDYCAHNHPEPGAIGIRFEWWPSIDGEEETMESPRVKVEWYLREEYLEENEKRAKDTLKKLVTELHQLAKSDQMLTTRAVIEDVTPLTEGFKAKIEEGKYYRRRLEGVEWERIFGPIPEPTDEGYPLIQIDQEWPNEPEPDWYDRDEPAESGSVRASDYNVAVRQGIVKAIGKAHPQAKGKNLDELTCQELDSRRAAIPDRWRVEYGISNWVEGYNHPKVKLLIQRMFSGDRRKE